MTVTYRVDTNELSVGLINSIKETFKNKVIDITITEAFDETEFLLASEANKESLLNSMQQLKDGKGITFSIDELQKRYAD